MEIDTELVIAGHPAADWRVLVIEDSATFQALIVSMLERQGFQVSVAADGAAGIAAVSHWHPDLVLLDLGLPDIDGMDVCEEIRAISDAFVVVLTGRDDDETRFSGLAIGADSYISKPVEARELILRMEVLLRRSKPRGGLPDVVLLGGLVLDRPAGHVTVDDELVHLTKIEWQLLERLASGGGETVTREQLMACLWGPNWVGDDHVISVHVANLRKKIDPTGLGRISTVRGVGYRLLER